MFTQKFIKIFHSVQEIGLFSLFRIWTSATPRPIQNDIWQSLGLHLVNINAYAKFYQNIPNGLGVIDIFHEQAGVKIFTDPASKSSQTVRWKNQMFDYRALYEIQLQVSVDFLRVVQLIWSWKRSLYDWNQSTIKQLVKTNCRWLFILFCLSYTLNRYMYDPIIDACRYTIRLIIDCDKIIQLSGDSNMD